MRGYIAWWKRGTLSWREALLTLPFLVIGFAMGLMTMHAEKHLGISANGWNLSWLGRCLIAGKDFWFYLEKVFWPHPLMYVYPRWEINTFSAIDYLPLLAMVMGLLILWRKRNERGRSIFVTSIYFVVLLALVLGFFNMFYFRDSFVSDHFQYLAMLGPLAL
jgi:uncharacterized membrane protein YfcA